MEMTLDFGFGYNDAIFSDRMLHIVILPDDKPPSGSKPDKNEDHRKPACDGQFQNPKGNEAPQQNETSPEMHCSEYQQKSIWVNSLLLAAHSPFFHKLFSNGMKESGQPHATIHIQASEEAAFMDLLKFMYSGKLLGDAPSALGDVIRVADKFSVASCIKLCGQLLINIPITLELALLYLDLDLNSLMEDSIRPQLDAAKKFMVERFKDINKAELQEELLELPLVGVEAVLSSDHLQIKSEDEIYDFMLKWVQAKYSDQLEERTAINMLVRRFLRFPFLSTEKLESILTNSYIDPAVASELALGALRYFKAQPPHQQTVNKAIKRAYTNLPLKVVVVGSSSSHPHCIVYLDLKRDECLYHLDKGAVKSQSFFVGEHQFSLSTIHHRDIYGSLFGIQFYSSTRAFRIACEIASMVKPGEEFVRRIHGDYNMAKAGGSMATGWLTVFSSTGFYSTDSPYFINDYLHLRCDIKIKN